MMLIFKRPHLSVYIFSFIEIQSAAPDSTCRGEKVGSPSVTSVCSAEKQAGNKAEEAKIAELLNRGDTAVIYPEPVSDNEEQQNNEGTCNFNK